MNILRGAYPPSFCQWRALLGVAVVSLLASVLILLGHTAPMEVGTTTLLMAYALALGLFCALVLCTLRAWLQRMEMNRSWVTAWVIVVIAATAFSYAAAVIGTVLGWGPGREMALDFVGRSVLAIAIVWAAMLRYLFIRLQWEAETLAEAEARVQALQARIRPHFLFNSLNTIASLTQENPDSAERATEDLADLFRAGMRRADQLISMEEELRLAQKYLEMEQRRLGDRLRVDWQAEDVPHDASVLPMILQPLLENAVGHGIQPRTDGGELKLFGRREGNSVVVTISNPVAEADDQPGHGMALRNIRARLELAYGGRSSLVTYQDDDCYYAVLTLPYVEIADH